jgi:hypothetical protein
VKRYGGKGFVKLQEELMEGKSKSSFVPDDIICLSDDTTITFKEVADMLGDDVKANTLASRWFPVKVEPIYKGLSCPSLKIDGKVSGFGAKAIARWYFECYKPNKYQGEYESLIRAEYQQFSVKAEVVPDDMPHQTSRHETIDDAIARKQEQVQGTENETLSLLADIAAIAVQEQHFVEQGGSLEALSLEQKIYLDEMRKLKEAKEAEIKERQIREKARRDFEQMMRGKTSEGD